ncbi:MAG: hypothetical protein M1814_003466 [Vezdaea aestivalis]|nr:MAG: hypothetical protein M1814_003466 [Vezdaea aestivalis]
MATPKSPPPSSASEPSRRNHLSSQGQSGSSPPSCPGSKSVDDESKGRHTNLQSLGKDEEGPREAGDSKVAKEPEEPSISLGSTPNWQDETPVDDERPRSWIAELQSQNETSRHDSMSHWLNDFEADPWNGITNCRSGGRSD